MIAVLILICAGAVAKPDCQLGSAMHVIQGPDAGNAVMCAFQGQAFVAQSAFGRTMQDGEYVKILCRPKRAIGQKPTIQQAEMPSGRR